MKTVTVSKRTLLLLALLIIAGSILAIDIVHGRGEQEAGAGVETGAEAAAEYALSEALRFDYTEGQEAWAERVRPLCTETGWSFWNLTGVQMWPRVIETQYAVQDIDVLGSRVIEGEADLVVVEVAMQIAYVQNGEERSQEQSYRIIMVRQGNDWLMDIPDSGQDQ